jgi:CRISPR system Cascade subunit CasA
VLWREYGNLFHTTGPDDSAGPQPGTVLAPAVVQQLAQLQMEGIGPEETWHFRCVGMRTDMKAKIFEWVDEVLDVPTGLLADPAGQIELGNAVTRAEQWSSQLNAIFRRVFSAERERYDHVRQRMQSAYWSQLAGRFRELVLAAAESSVREAALRGWSDTILVVGEGVLNEALDEIGDRGDRLRQRVEALSRYRMARAAKLKEWHG